MDSVVAALVRKGGQATFAELIGATSRREVAEALRQGVIERLARGIYGLPGHLTDRRVAAAYDGAVSHLSAAVVWDLPLLAPPEKPHVTVPTKRRPRPGPPVVLHWSQLAPADRSSRLTSLLRTVVDCARILPFGEALAVADAALAGGMVRRSQLTAATTAMRGAGRPNACRVAAAASGAVDSFLESMLRSLLVTAGIEGFEPQVAVETASLRARVDLGHRRARLALEADGYEFHGSRSDFAADCHRYDELVAAGWLVLRFTYRQVISDPAWVVATIRRTLAQRLSPDSQPRRVPRRTEGQDVVGGAWWCRAEEAAGRADGGHLYLSFGTAGRGRRRRQGSRRRPRRSGEG